MKTDELIVALAAQPPQPALIVGRLALRVVVSLIVICSVFLAVFGLRPAVLEAMANPLVLVKTALPALIFVLALRAALTLARPENNASLKQLILPLGAAAVLLLIGAVTQPFAIWFADVSAFSVIECFGSITLLSIVPLGVFISALRKGASTEPRLSGAMAGLVASAGAATGYSLFCTQDNPIFYVIWYGLAIALATLIGAALGGKFLRW